VDVLASIEIPIGQRHPRLPKYRSLGALPDRQRKKASQKCSAPLGSLARAFSPRKPQRAGTDSTRSDAERLADPEFSKEFHKLTGDDPTPLMPEALEKAIREMPRDADVVELFNKLAGPEPLPPR
jgi:hypothetical protein